MLVVRPIVENDFEALLHIARESGHGFTSLPVNNELLEKRITRSVKALAQELSEPGDQGYLFVLEDTETKKLVGTSGIEASVGLDDAFYHYHLSKVVHSSRELNVYNTAELLTLCNDYTGLTEICTLFLLPEQRHSLNGRLMSKFRFLFIAEHSERFGQRVFAEMRGVSDEHGISPFWRWLDDNFFSIDFPTADYLSGIGHKQFIAELMPKYPIYVNLLSKAAQAVIGQTHESTLPALKLLEQEGFSWRGYVDIFDAGPTVEAQLGDIRSVRASDKVSIHVVDESGYKRPQPLLIINSKLVDFRAAIIEAEIDSVSQTVKLTEQQADVLMMTEGDSARVLWL